MTEEATEASVVKEMSNGDSPVVSDDVLQNMRRGLFGKSVPQDEPTPLSGADLQETSNGSADTDGGWNSKINKLPLDSKKNGVSFEDKELPDQREDIDVEDAVVERPELPVVEEPSGSIEIAQEPEANPEVVEDMEIIEIQEAEINVPVVEADPANVEIPERVEADEEEAEPYAVDVENNGEEVIHIEEIPEENIEVEEPIQEPIQVEEEAAQVMEVDEEPEEDEHPEDPVVNNAAINGVVEASASPPSTPVQPAAEEEEADKEIEVDVEDEPKEEEKEDKMVVVEEEEETPQSSRRSKRAVKEEEAPKPTPKGRGRRGAQKEVEETPQETKTPKRGGRRGAKQEEEKAEEPFEEEEEAQEKTPVEEAPAESKRSTRRGRGQAKEEPKEEKAETPKRGTRRGRGKKEEEEPKEEEQDEETEEKMEEEHIDVEGEEPEEEPKSTKKGSHGKGKTPASAPKRGGRRGKVEEAEPVEEGEDDEEPKEKEEIEKPKRSIRRGHAESGSEKSLEVKETPRRGAKRGQPKEEEKKKEEEAEEDQIGLEEEGEEPEEAPKTKRRSTRGKAAQTPAKATRGKKAEVKKEEEEEEEEDEEKEETEEPTPKRALRTRGAKAEPPASSKSAKGRSRSQKKGESEIEEEEEAEDVKEEPKTSKGRGKKAAKAKTNVADPYDVDSQFDQHPDPLKNVVVCEGMFGSTKYGKIGSGKYTFTEKAAEERIGNLSDLLPKQVNRRSLADLTPGRRRGVGSKGTKSAPPARKRKGNDSDEEMDIDEPGSSKTGSRKRKSSPTTATPPKSAKLELPSLNDDKQWIVDHPPDEHAPIEIGARVYAVFDKIYYPAVIIAERDGLGRYKVSFDEDKVIRDIPAQGIVPLRAVVADKECYYGDDGAIIVACPNAASASEWAKAIFTIRLLDNEGEVTGNDIRCAWSKLSLDMNNWKDYIHQKSIEATAVAADNISAHSRTRRSHAEAQKAATPQHKSTKPTPKATKSVKKAGKTRAEGESTEAKEGAKEEEEEEELDCFAGMVFLLTSAQRDGNSNFKKKMLVDFIVERKGLVVEDFNDLETFGDRRPFLISDTYYRTHKYLSALAKGVPCVSHEWIHRCVELETAVDYTEFVLPAGTSSIDGRLFPLPVNQNVLLSGKNVLIYSGNNLHNPRALNYYNIWAPLVTYMGGHPIRNLNDLGRNERINIIISDNSITDAMLDRADHDGSWVVTSEWLIHAIIMDETTDPETFPRFKVARANRNFPPSDPE